MADDLLNVNDAKALVDQHTIALSPVTVLLQYAGGKTLAADVLASVNVPAFSQSGMDGYALAFDSLGKAIKIEGEQAAGTSRSEG